MRGLRRDRAVEPLSPIFPATTTTPFLSKRKDFKKSFRFACFIASPLYYLRAWHRLLLAHCTCSGSQLYIRTPHHGNSRSTEKKGKLDRIIRRELFLAGPTREIPSRQLVLSQAANQSTGFLLSCLLVD